MPDKALENYRRAIALQPDYYEAYEWLGTFYYYSGKYTEAVQEFQKAIERAPGRSSAYFNLGAVLDVLERDDEAIVALQKSLSLKKTARALNSLGAIMAYQWKDHEAAEYYRQAVNIELENYKYRINLADSDRRLGQRLEAIRQYRSARSFVVRELRQNPNSGATRAFLGYLKMRLGDANDALNEIAQALAEAPHDSQVLRTAILTYEAVSQRKHALEIARHATQELLLELRRHPDLAELWADPRFIELLQVQKEKNNHAR